MKKFFTTVILSCTLAVSAMAVTVKDASGVFKGLLNIGGTPYNNKEVYILPGVQENTITFVLPDFKYGAASLGDIVLPNISMSTSGQLTLDDASLYIKAISERAVIAILNGVQDGSTTYNSVVSGSSAQVLLSIAAPSLPEPIMVLFSGSKVTDRNYALTNGGFEGSWSNSEPNGWHSFPSATGSLASMAGGEDQFKQSTEKRPGSTGSHSALIASNLIVGVKANGNCTNGQINAGSTTADDANGNYNFSDPSNNGFNTPFVGKPDSIVFWAKYIPADKNPSNSVNKARMHTVITTNARYQDPEASNYSSVKVAEAAINYTATSTMGWQRLAVPFSYSSVDPSKAAYILVTFTTNMTPGGGSTYSEGSIFNKKYYYDNIYLDDVEMVYNHGLKSLLMNGSAVTFTNGTATTSEVFSDSDYDFVATTNGKAAKSFIAYDATINEVYIYVVADSYSQAGTYSVYTLQMAAPQPPVVNTDSAYTATICDNESYSDDLFSGLTQAGTYVDTISNTQGGDSVVTLTLIVNKSYSYPAEATMKTDETYTWREKEYKGLTPGVYTFADSLTTVTGCDSVYTLTLTVEPIGYWYEETMHACVNEQIEWRGMPLPTEAAGNYVLYDSLLSVQGMDSVYVLKLSVHPVYLFTEEQHVEVADLVWHGKTIKDLDQREEPYLIYDSLTSQYGCDSVYMLRLYVYTIPTTYGSYSDECCEGEFILFDGVEYRESFEGDVLVSERNMYGGDSIVHLTIKVFPSYHIEEEMTIVAGEARTWEYYDLSELPVGTMTLTAEYWSDDFCDSIRVLHLTINDVFMALPYTPSDEHYSQKVLINGQLYIIRKDEKYTILGTKIQ